MPEQGFCKLPMLHFVRKENKKTTFCNRQSREEYISASF
jgi:hypothetical protein